jgi:4-hydroxybenzoate polyprenyltransferase
VGEAEKPGRRERPWWAFLLKVSRPGFYSTTLWFYLLTVGQRNVFGDWKFWLGAAYFTLPFGLLLYGWNDYGDRATDRLNPRKDSFLWGARGSDSELDRLPLWIALAQAPFLAVFVSLFGVKALVWFGLLLLANLLYNAEPFRFKSRPPLELVNQAGYLLVFVMGVWLNGVPDLPLWTYVYGAAFAMMAHLFGQILDVDPDAAAGRKTTAVLLGLRGAKWLLVAFLVGLSALTWFVYRSWVLGGFFAGAALWFALDNLVLWRGRQYEPWQIRLFGQGLNVMAVASIPYMWWTGVLTRVS